MLDEEQKFYALCRESSAHEPEFRVELEIDDPWSSEPPLLISVGGRLFERCSFAISVNGANELEYVECDNEAWVAPEARVVRLKDD